MKLGLLLAVIAVVLGGLIGTLVVRDPGYVLLSYGDMAFETSLWFALVLLALVYLLLRFLFWLFTRTLAGTGRFGSWLKRRRATRAQKQTVRGLLLMSEGQWAEARKVLVASAREVGTPLINYLSAARAAHELGDAEGRDALLRQAHESTPGSKFAVGLTQAELQRNAEQWEQSLATLLQLKSASPRHPQVLRMLSQVYEELADWQALIELLPEIRKRKILPEPAFETLQKRAWVERFGQAGSVADALFRDVPKELKRDPDVVAAYAGALVGADQANEAEAAIRSALQHRWDDDLVLLYGQVIGADPTRQLVVAEGWLQEKPNDPSLLLTLGRICMMNQAWSKAREYFETSLRLQRTPDVYGELGRLCVSLGEYERGGEYLAHATIGLPPLPLPEKRPVKGVEA